MNTTSDYKSYMSRTGTAYPTTRLAWIDRERLNNQYIRRWWTAQHDQLLIELLTTWQWAWEDALVEWGCDQLLDLVPYADLEQWQLSDPLLSSDSGNRHRLVEDFTRGRVHELNLKATIRRPKNKRCSICGNKFVEHSVPWPLLHRLNSIDHILWCPPCLAYAFYRLGSKTVSRSDALDYIGRLSQILERVPPQEFGNSPKHFEGLRLDQISGLVTLFSGQRPTPQHIRATFGSWLNALIGAGVLEGNVRRTSRGTQCVAMDGHICFSLSEKTIDDLLYQHGIQHEREPGYPEGNYRADFRVNDVFIEYFGLQGDPDYDDKIKEKHRLCKKHGVRLVAIYPGDLASGAKIERKLQEILLHMNETT